MNIDPQRKKDVTDMPIRKPAEPLPAIFISPSGFTTRKRDGVRKAAEAAPKSRSVMSLRSNSWSRILPPKKILAPLVKNGIDYIRSIQ